jgi:hypothetical protein
LEVSKVEGDLHGPTVAKTPEGFLAATDVARPRVARLKAGDLLTDQPVARCACLHDQPGSSVV